MAKTVPASIQDIICFCDEPQKIKRLPKGGTELRGARDCQCLVIAKAKGKAKRLRAKTASVSTVFG